MPEDKFTFLGNCIRSARKDCQLTQQELADQSGLAVKTIQDTYNTLMYCEKCLYIFMKLRYS